MVREDGVKKSSQRTVRETLLEALKHAAGKGEHISGEVLSNILSISRTAIWKHINTLRKDGYRISSVTNKGYKLEAAPDLLLPAELHIGLHTNRIGHVIKYYPETSSTNITARALAEAGASDGTLVVAETQTSGRGRRGRAWSSPRGGIWLTIILRPSLTPNLAPILTLLTGVAVACTVQAVTGLEAKLKWPNDIRINGKKACGILTELSAEQDAVNYVLVGVGINANFTLNELPGELRAQATSLQEELGSKLDRVAFTKELLTEFEAEYSVFLKNPSGKIPQILSAWQELSDTLNRRVRVQTADGVIKGVAKELAEDGALVLVTADGERHRIIAGDCEYLRQ